jgi:3'-phosphoadenosine 5'-phosphosulfate sulfotransferase (PAPS reductase)/FAD synthetase
MENPTLRQLIRAGALFVINSSAGKDSQAMTIRLMRVIPNDQLVIVHSHLPGVEWDGSVEHIKKYSADVPVFVTQAKKTFFEMVDHRQKFPDAQRRQCTSDLKRDPIDREIRRIAKERGKLLIVSCMGMRAQESPNRSKLKTFKLSERNSKAGRTWYDWLPIHSKATTWVFDTIHNAGQKAFWIYYRGMTRKSCRFCILGSQHDLKLAKALSEEMGQGQIYQEYRAREEKYNFTVSMSRKNLDEMTA